MTSCYFGDGGWCFAWCSCGRCRCCCCYCCRCVRVWFHYFICYTFEIRLCGFGRICSEERRNHNSKCLRFLSMKMQGEKFGTFNNIMFGLQSIASDPSLQSFLWPCIVWVRLVIFHSFKHSNIHFGCAAVVSVWMHRSMSLQFIAEIQIGRSPIGHLFLANWKTIMLTNSSKTHRRTATMTRMKIFCEQWQRPA